MRLLAHPPPDRGFALITVLVSLATITLLFAAASTLTLTRLQDNALTHGIGRKAAEARGVIEGALAHYGSPDIDLSEPLVLHTADGDWRVALRDVSGLVDLNTASPALLAAIMPALGLDTSEASVALERLRTWRRAGNRLARVSDALRVMGLDAALGGELASIATVASGATGFAPEQAPLRLLEVVTGRSGPRDTLADSVPEAFRSPARGANFRLIAAPAGANLVAIVVVNRSQDDWRLISAQR